jgi:PAS domain S-box-containing protein
MSNFILTGSMAVALEILIVDDDELTCERLEALLATSGMRAISVQSLEAAREAMRAVYFPVVILDRHLGDGDGADLCREYRARQSDKRVRILILSGSDTPEDERVAVVAGADAFLSKRVTDHGLTEKVSQLYAAACGARPRVPAHGIANDAEAARLGALADYSVLDSAPEQLFDDITLLASRICKTPIALISFIDGTRQWFKSKVGIDVTEAPREHAFCAHAICEPNDVFVVPDAHLDARFADNPLVTGDPHVRFYAGAPLVTADGHALGTVCVIDREPRELDDEARECLRALSRQVIELLEGRKLRRALEVALVAQRATDADLRRSEVLFREAFENAPIGKALVSPPGQWLRVNRALCDIVGYSAQELLRTTFQTVTHPDDIERDLEHINEMLANSRRTYEMEKRYIHKRGHIVWVQLSVSLVRDEQQAPFYFVAQIQDITARKHLERAKSEFLAMVSHELRTPVTAVRGSLGLLEAGKAGELPPKAQSLVTLANRNADRLQRLISDLLDIEKIESGTFSYDRTLLDVDALVAGIVEEMTPYADQFETAVAVKSSSLNVRLIADRERIGQVVANLISNAVKFSPKGKTVDVTLEHSPERVRVKVADYGSGIPAEFHGMIFQKFAQANASGSTRKGGTGLGLSISKAIVEAHHGAIGFDTSASGTTFWFELPALPTGG